MCSRHFYDVRLAAEIGGECLGEVRGPANKSHAASPARYAQGWQHECHQNCTSKSCGVRLRAEIRQVPCWGRLCLVSVEGMLNVLHPCPVLQEFNGYIFKIMGGQDKQGFAMKQGVLTNDRVRLLMSPGDKCFQGFGRRKGERRRKSVRGCIISQDTSVLNLLIVKKGACPNLSDPLTG